MSGPEIIGIIGLLIMLIALFLGIHIGVVLGGVGLAGCIVLIGFTRGVSLLATTTYYTAANYGFIALPMFLLMGELAFQGGIGSLLYAAVSRWLGHYHGGLPMATTVANALFATIAGDSLSATATFGKIAIPEMIRYKCDPSFSCGVVASAGCLAVLIPPSGVMILFCIFTSVSLGELMIAGFLPGCLSALIYMTYIYTRVRFNPRLAPKSSHVPSWTERWKAVRWLIPIFVVVIVMFGGIYLGIFSPVEAGAIGAFTILLLVLGRRSLFIDTFKACLANVARTVSMIFFVMLGAMIFSKFLVVAGIPDLMMNFISNLNVSPIMILIVMLAIYLILGTFMGVVAMLAVTLPIFFPLSQGIGFEGVWFGIIVILMCEIAALTPPVGLNVFVLKAVVGDLVPIGAIFKGVLPFFFLNILIIIILITIPKLSLWLPSMMYG